MSACHADALISNKEKNITGCSYSPIHMSCAERRKLETIADYIRPVAQCNISTLKQIVHLQIKPTLHCRCNISQTAKWEQITHLFEQTMRYSRCHFTVLH